MQSETAHSSNCERSLEQSIYTEVNRPMNSLPVLKMYVAKARDDVAYANRQISTAEYALVAESLRRAAATLALAVERLTTEARS